MKGTRLKYLAFALTILVSLATILGGCSRLGERSLRLPANPILTGGLGWGVVKEAYVRLKEAPSDSSRDLDHLRRGAVYRLDSRDLGAAGKVDSGQKAGANDSGERGLWYGLETELAKGWVHETELDIFLTQAQAEKAAAAYR